MLNRSHLIAMIYHWLSTPVNGYFGSSYGADLNSMLLKPLSSDVADKFLRKMRADIPMLQQVDSSQLNIYVNDEGFEKKHIILQIGQIAIDLTQMNDNLQS